MICTAFHHQWKMQWGSLLKDTTHKMSTIKRCIKMPPEKSSSRTAWNHVTFHLKLFQTSIGTFTIINWPNKNVSQIATMPKFFFTLVIPRLSKKIFIGISLEQKLIINRLRISIQIGECTQVMKKDLKRPE